MSTYSPINNLPAPLPTVSAPATPVQLATPPVAVPIGNLSSPSTGGQQGGFPI